MKLRLCIRLVRVRGGSRTDYEIPGRDGKGDRPPHSVCVCLCVCLFVCVFVRAGGPPTTQATAMFWSQNVTVNSVAFFGRKT